MSPVLCVDIYGLPGTFATAKERPWRDAVNAAVGSPTKDVSVIGLDMIFNLTSPEEGHFAQDPDNLAEPVFAELIGKLGWFTGRRPLVQWFRVVKKYTENQSMLLSVWDRHIWFTETIESKVVLSAIYQGSFPASATDMSFCEWIAQQPRASLQGRRYEVSLLFEGQKPNIANIATGDVKHIIDCLYPVIGGKVGAPEDWRIHTLYVAKNVRGLPQDSVAITVKVI